MIGGALVFEDQAVPAPAEDPEERARLEAARLLGRRGGLKGGPARAAKLGREGVRAAALRGWAKRRARERARAAAAAKGWATRRKRKGAKG